jgi:type II secretory pathway component GspD/PulD (secretin)
MVAQPGHVARWLVALTCLAVPSESSAQEPAVSAHDGGVVIQLVDADIRAAVQALAPYLDRPVVFGSGLGAARITIETPGRVPRLEMEGLLRGVLAAEGMELAEEGQIYVVRHRAASAAERVGNRGDPGALPQLFVLRLRHASAVEVAATVNALYGLAAVFGELGARPTLLPDELRQQQIPPVREGTLPAARGRVAALGNEAVIVPDTRTNTLLVRATPLDFELIEAAVIEIDIRPLQVLVEVLVIEARRDRAFSLGVTAVLGPTAIPDRLGLPEGDVSASSAGLGLGDFAIRVMGVAGLDLNLELQAAAARGDVSIVSRPILLTANNEVAHILVGSQRPFVQVQRSMPTEALVRDQVVQYKDVGTQLTIQPTISDDGYVMLRVTQEVNAATTETAFDAPVISTRAVQTNLLVRDRQTVVLGGLMDRQRDATHAGIPVLSRLPLIGPLFGRTSRRAVDTELFVFLTPRIIRSDADVDSLQEDLGRGRKRLQVELQDSRITGPPPPRPDSILQP